jgi:thiol-disulfide isomerase/thioredoxin
LGGLAASVATPAFAADKKPKAEPPEAPEAPAFFTSGPMAQNKVASDFRAVPPGLVLPPKLKLMGPKEGPHSLDDYRGKTIILSLWAEWCQWCLIEMPVFDKINQLFANDKFEIVTVLTSTDRIEGWKDARRFLDTRLKSPRLAALMEPGDRLARTLATTDGSQRGSLPCNLLIDPNGVIRARCIGASTYMYNERKITTWATEDGVLFSKALAAGLMA